jgi:nucleotidyltransferase substrate binding protein (TIGR01987 family)
MKLLLKPLEKALKQLQRSLTYLGSPPAKKDPVLREQFRAASIQAFEYSYELAAKMIRRQLAQIEPSSAEVREMAFADLLRTAADAGLIPDVKRFLDYRDARNRTSHTYEESTAKEVAKVIPHFVKDVSFLLTELQKRNR